MSGRQNACGYRGDVLAIAVELNLNRKFPSRAVDQTRFFQM
jgi:hypothetical protein